MIFMCLTAAANKEKRNRQRRLPLAVGDTAVVALASLRLERTRYLGNGRECEYEEEQQHRHALNPVGGKGMGLAALHYPSPL